MLFLNSHAHLFTEIYTYAVHYLDYVLESWHMKLASIEKFLVYAYITLTKVIRS